MPNWGRTVGVVMLDVPWLREARKIAAMAKAYQLPVAPHDCPVEWVFIHHFEVEPGASYPDPVVLGIRPYSGSMTAAASLVTAPAAVLVLLVQRYLVKGLTMGGPEG